jgi:acyl-CoA synthetase (AMP-forming)/AMP-acid ligase II
LAYGGSPMAPELIRRVREVLPNLKLVQGYGLTEAGFLTGLQDHEHTEDRLMSCGRACPGIDVRVVDKSGKEVGVGHHGELVARGANVTCGYWNNPEETTLAFRNGMFRTGDVGYQDADGYFYILDRLKDMIVTGGENVYSGEVEAVIYELPAVREVAVFGFAEQLQAPVFLAPLADRASFPETHPQFRGMLPIAIGPLSKTLRGHDLTIVIGAPVFRYYPYLAGDYLPEGAELLQIVSDPADAGAAAVGDSLLGDAKLALESLFQLVPKNKARSLPALPRVDNKLPSPPNDPLTAREAFAALSELRPDNAILVNESASNAEDVMRSWPTVQPESYFSFASGGLGWGAPAAVGIALAQRKTDGGRPVVAFIGDGAFQYLPL